MLNKTCHRCKIEKSVDDFYKDFRNQDGLCGTCKSCCKESREKYKSNNLEKIKSIGKKYYEKNKEEIKIKSKIYRNKTKKRIVEYNKKYRKEHKETILLKAKIYNNLYKYTRNKNRKEKWGKDPLDKLKHNIRNLISISLKNKGYTKKSKTYQILGCSFEEFKTYIESKFESWMNWENYGEYNGEYKSGWDYDHIISLKNVKNEKDLIKLNYYTNFQPLDSKINRFEKK